MTDTMKDTVAKAIAALEASIARDIEWTDFGNNASSGDMVIASDDAGFVLVSHNTKAGTFEYTMGGAGASATSLTPFKAGLFLKLITDKWPKARLVSKIDYVTSHIAQMQDLINGFSKHL